MTCHTFCRTVFIGCMSLACSGIAQASIVQCIDEAGTVVYTDAPCQEGTDVAPVSALPNPSIASLPDSPPVSRFVYSEAARLKNRAHSRGMASDVATVKAARSSMLLMDEASSLQRQQKLAALDLKNQHWFNF